MELRDPPHPLRAGRQERSPEMQRAFFLTEARPGDDADARGVEEAEAVELVRGAVFFPGLLDGAGREGDGGVEVHGALDFGCRGGFCQF